MTDSQRRTHRMRRSQRERRRRAGERQDELRIPSLGETAGTAWKPRTDTDIYVRSAKDRRQNRPPSAVAFLAIVLGLLAIATIATAFNSNARTPGGVVVGEADQPPGALEDPTPVFAAYEDIHLHLPVAPESVTALAFHQASIPLSGAEVLHLESFVPDAAGEGAVQASTDIGVPVWEGSCLRLWRSGRTGTPDNAVDVGAAPGTDVLSPVSGQVVKVREYQLYQEHTDYEIHIVPDGHPEIEVVLVHVDDLSVSEGDTVVGGVTRIASIRLLSDRISHQLGQYTADGGDHVHLQLNRGGTSDGGVNGS